MTPLDVDEITNINVAKLHRAKMQTPVERRAQALYDTGRYSEEEAERIALETLEEEPCERS